VSAALAAAAAAGRPPLLRELLVEPSWVEVLGGEFDKPYMASLQTFLEGEWAKAGAKVYPPQDSVFR
jgi:uracil-DNA glycosylase